MDLIYILITVLACGFCWTEGRHNGIRGTIDYLEQEGYIEFDSEKQFLTKRLNFDIIYLKVELTTFIRLYTARVGKVILERLFGGKKL